jgi:predicted AAA+ superfamily ATPase
MKIQSFDLNDICNEPTDEQLQSLMDDVAEEVRRKREETMSKQEETLQQQITDAQNKWFPPSPPLNRC